MLAPKNKPTFGNLPIPLSTFIGREHEIAEIQRLLASNRLITLTGPGGCGKTRLGLKVAHELLKEFENAVWFIELASITDSWFVPQTIATILNVREQLGRPLEDVLTNALVGAPALLILDNCEHLILTCAQITENLLKRCPHLKIITTSREILGIPGEVALTVPPLSLPAQQPWTNPASAQHAIGLYGESESVQLFVTRATSHAPDFELSAENGAWVAEICRHLDGMPLAIELAAARVRSLSVQQIAQRLDDRFNLLTGGSRTAPLRQQTLVSTLDWSYALLSEAEQKVLQRLSVFAGGASLEGAEWVCAGGGIESADVLDLLSHLVDKSLVTAELPKGRELRYQLLETIRQYAYDKLSEAGEVEECRARHTNYFIQWAETADPYLIGDEPLKWLALYETEHDNLCTAMEWCNLDDRRSEAGLRLAAASGRFWRIHGYLTEGRMRLSAALSKPGAQGRTMTRARALTLLSNHLYLQSDYPAMRPLAEEALSIWRELGDPGKAGAAFTLDLLGELGTEEGDYDTPAVLYQEALEIYRELNDLKGVGQIYMQFGWLAMRVGNYAEAQKYLEEFQHLAQQQNDTTNIAYSFSGLGEVEIRLGQYERAVALLEQGLELNRLRGDKWGTATMLGSLGWIALRQHDFKQTREMLGESLSVRMEMSDRGGIAWCLEKLAEAKYEQSQFQEAAKIFGHAESVRTPIGSVIDPADREEYRRILSRLRSALGKDEFAVFWTEGASMQLEEVIDCALSESAPPIELLRSEKEKFRGLTAREREVAILIAQGKSNREIAEAMTVGVKTIETYVTRILNKLNFDSRVQIATWAMEKGLR